MKNNFSRSNVNESTLDIKSPLRSSFNLSHNSRVSLPLGVLMPCNIEPLLPTDVVSGSLTPQLQLEKIMTPSIGRTRLDTHTFVVNARRVNRDFVSLRGDNTGSKPSFSAFDLYGLNLLNLINGTEYDSSLNRDVKIFSSLDDEDTFGIWLELVVGDDLASIANKIIQKSIDSYSALLADTDCDRYGYMRDFYSIEKARLEALPTFTNNQYAVIDAICEVLKPYCGAGSQLDMLGYPVITRFGNWAQNLITLQNGNETPYDAYNNLIVGKTFNVVDFELNEVEGSEYLTPVYESSIRIVDETPLRVVYAVWYDYFRNYHVEKRAYFLNPDDFGSTAIINSFGITDVQAWQRNLQLIIPKYRMFARDYLTTIETEDKFRFVYSPIATDTNAINGEVSQIDVDNDFYNEIIELGLPKFAVNGANFPLPFFNNNPVTNPIAEPTITKVLRADLQTMRRSGMLEKWLARNYFYPDTYVGQLLARYQVTPSDVAIINAEYIGGNESFISTDQVTANVTTDSTPMGQRVLKGDVALDDSFVYSATDYCYLVSFISLMPLVGYDSPNMHLHELTSTEFPDPEFAEDTRVAIRPCDVLRGFDANRDVLGYVPRYYQYRVHPDETHGRFLTDYRSYNWFRDWYNMNFTLFEKADYADYYKRSLTLNPYSLRVHIEPDAFLGLRMWDDIAFGLIDIQCHIQRPLPAAVEFI